MNYDGEKMPFLEKPLNRLSILSYLRIICKYLNAYKSNFILKIGFKVALQIGVFLFVLLLGSGSNFILTYGSDRPFGSMGIRFLHSRTMNKEDKSDQLGTIS